MAIGNFFTGIPAQSQQFPTITPQQAGVKGAASNQALQYLQGLGGGSFGTSPIAQQARNRFETQTIPGLAERFTSLGSGAQRSSAFAGLLGQQGAGLEQGLAGLEQQNMLQLLPYLLQASLQPEAETGITEQQPGFLQTAGSSILPILTALIGSYFGGPAGGAAGAAGGSALNDIISNLFKGNKQQQSMQGSGSGFPDYGSLFSNITKPRF